MTTTTTTREWHIYIIADIAHDMMVSAPTGTLQPLPLSASDDEYEAAQAAYEAAVDHNAAVWIEAAEGLSDADWIVEALDGRPGVDKVTVHAAAANDGSPFAFGWAARNPDELDDYTLADIYQEACKRSGQWVYPEWVA